MGLDYKRLEFELYGLLLQAKELMSDQQENEEIIAQIENELERIKTKKYHVAVVGEFRRGKSSLINALLGLPVLPADATPTTATVNRITYGDVPAATIYYKDGTCRRLNGIEELPEYVTKLSKEREAVAKTVREAVVEYPIVICQNHVDIIDTPGLSDDDEMTRVTIGLLKRVDAAIVAVSALAPFAESEKKFVTQLIANPGVTGILFVVTFIDMLDEDEYPKVFQGIKNRIREMTLKEVESQFPQEEWIREKAHRILDQPLVYGVSAKKALKAFTTNNRKMLLESQFPKFKEDLFTILTAGQSVNMVQKAIASLESAADWERKQFETQLKTIAETGKRLESLPGKIEEYARASIRRIDALLVEKKEQMHQLEIKELDDAPLLAIFIENLSQVKIPDSEVVRQAIIKSASEDLEKIQLETNQTAEEMLSLFESIVVEYGKEQKEILEDIFCCDLKMDFSVYEFQEVTMNALREVSFPEFTWMQPLWPDVSDLMECNVIETIENGLRAALESMQEKKKEYTKNLRAALFTKVRQEKENLQLLSKNTGALRKEKEENTTQLKNQHEMRQVELEQLVKQAKALIEE